MEVFGNHDKVIAAVLDDAERFAGGVRVFENADGRAVKVGEWTKCCFSDFDKAGEYMNRYGISGNVCLMGVPEDHWAKLDKATVACKTFAYLDPLPPTLDRGVQIKRLAPTLCGVVSEKYDRRGEGVTREEAEALIRTQGVFGAFVQSRLAGFIGRHDDGGMGLLTIFEQYRRRGLGEELEKFMINYVMSFLRVPFCDVYIDNAPSLALQEKLCMSAAVGRTYWIDNFDTALI